MTVLLTHQMMSLVSLDDPVLRAELGIMLQYRARVSDNVCEASAADWLKIANLFSERLTDGWDQARDAKRTARAARERIAQALYCDANAPLALTRKDQA